MHRLFKRLPNSLQQMAVYGSAMVIAKAMSLVMVPVFTHFLSPADFGRLDVLQTLANLLSIVIIFGLGQSLFRFSGGAETEDARQEIAAKILGLAAVIGITALILTQLFAPQIAALLPGGVTETQTRLILASLAVSGIRLVPMSWLRLSDRAYAYLMASAGCAVVQALFSALLLYLGYGIEGVLCAGLITLASFALFLAAHQKARTGLKLPEAEDVSRMGHFGGVLVIAGIAGFIMDSFPRWILAGTAGPAEMAMFALAAKFALITGFVLQPFLMWWLPRRFKVLNEQGGDSKAARATEAGLVISLLASVAVAGASPLLITWLTPEAYHGAIAFVPALCFLAALNGSIRLLNLGALTKEKTLWPLYIDGTAATLACAGYFLTIPTFGGWGIVCVTALAVSFRIAAYVWAGHRCRPLPFALAKLFMMLCLTTGGIVGLSLSPTPMASITMGTVIAALLILGAAAFKLLPRLPLNPPVAAAG